MMQAICLLLLPLAAHAASRNHFLQVGKIDQDPSKNESAPFESSEESLEALPLLREDRMDQFLAEMEAQKKMGEAEVAAHNQLELDGEADKQMEKARNQAAQDVLKEQAMKELAAQKQRTEEAVEAEKAEEQAVKNEDALLNSLLAHKKTADAQMKTLLQPEKVCTYTAKVNLKPSTELNYNGSEHGCQTAFGQCYWTSEAAAKSNCNSWPACAALYCTSLHQPSYVCFARTNKTWAAEGGDTKGFVKACVAQSASIQNFSAKNTSAQNASAQNASEQNASAQNASAQNASAQNASLQNATAQNASERNASAPNASVHNESTQNASAPRMQNETLRHNASVLNASARNASAQNTSPSVVFSNWSVGVCAPQCTWQCGTAKCDQVCKPKCQAPMCQTRCTGIPSTQGCKMECEKPQCAFVCKGQPCLSQNQSAPSPPPPSDYPGLAPAPAAAPADCPHCEHQCSKPMCKLVCPSGTQNCRNVCEHPRCDWDCKIPTVCPKPNCTLKCDTSKACADLSTTYKDLPPVALNEHVVAGFQPPVFLQEQLAKRWAGGQVPASALTVTVPITQAISMMGTQDLKLVKSTVELPVA